MTDDRGAPDRETIRRGFERRTGSWQELFDPVLEADPELMDAFARLYSVPWEKDHLSPLVREFIGIAINASTTHLYEPALRAHLKNAFALGAKREEVLEVFEMSSVVGIHTITFGLPILVEELERLGRPLETRLDEAQEEIKASYLEERGNWTPFFEDWVRLDPELMRAYLSYSTVPWKRGNLGPKVREFIYIAIDAQATHLYPEGTRMHIGNALDLGATREELIEVFEVVAVIGIHACTMGIPMVIEAIEATDSRDAAER